MRILTFAIGTCQNHEQLMQIAETMDKYIDMKIRANEYHVNLFTNSRVQPNLCNVTHPYIVKDNVVAHTFGSTLRRSVLSNGVSIGAK